MSAIHVLDQSTIDKIAAGEVVERPLSVVKELTENAIDAGASAITVEIKEGGISLIRVTDNGSGIEKGQVQKAFLRHATSKITSIEDLCLVESLGFRGEALSSIAAVAQVEVITKTAQELTGIRFSIAGGVSEAPEEIGAPTGTTFLVRNLFFNTPVRKKFLKQPQTEGGYVADLMERLSLSHPEISVKFIQNGQLKFHTSGNGSLKEIIYRIYGKDMANALLPFALEGSGFSVKGFLGKPQINRANRNFETCFVNGRYVRNDLINRAMEEGYKAYLMQHRFPFYVLHFSMEPGTVDVNVHPTKMEIRLIHGREVYEQLSRAVQERLHEAELIPDVSLEESGKKQRTADFANCPYVKNGVDGEPASTRPSGGGAAPSGARAAALSKGMPEPFEVRRMAMERGVETPLTNAVMEEGVVYGGERDEKPSSVSDFLHKMTGNKIIGGENGRKFTENAGIHSNVVKAGEYAVVEKPAQLNLFDEKFLSPQARRDYRILGQIFDTYWLIVFQDRLFIIDQHAAHEKVKYERLVKDLESRGMAGGSADSALSEGDFTDRSGAAVPSQTLNPPIIITLTGREQDVLKSYRSFFEELGFEMEDFGGSSIACRSIPLDLYGCNEKELFTDILDELAEAPLQGAPSVVLQKLASMACKAAVKGNQKLTAKEMEALIDELLTLDNPYHCPHGRPVIISMSKYEIEKKFKRIV